MSAHERSSRWRSEGHWVHPCKGMAREVAIVKTRKTFYELVTIVRPLTKERSYGSR